MQARAGVKSERTYTEKVTAIEKFSKKIVFAATLTLETVYLPVAKTANTPATAFELNVL